MQKIRILDEENDGVASESGSISSAGMKVLCFLFCFCFLFFVFLSSIVLKNNSLSNRLFILETWFIFQGKTN